MNRAAACLASIGIAYGVCAVSGVNRWMYMWLKGFYPAYVTCLWVALSVMLALLCTRFGDLRGWRLLLGAGVGYVAGIVAYQVAPAIRDGSFVRSASTIKVDGLLSYIGMSIAFPLLCLSPLTGLIAGLAFSALSRSSKVDRYVAAGVLTAVVVAGWSFFLSRSGVPAKW